MRIPGSIAGSNFAGSMVDTDLALLESKPLGDKSSRSFVCVNLLW